jgi:hypothetical protein
MRNHGTVPCTRGRLLNERLGAIKEMWTKERTESTAEFVDFNQIFLRVVPSLGAIPSVFHARQIDRLRGNPGAPAEVKR